MRWVKGRGMVLAIFGLLLAGCAGQASDNLPQGRPPAQQTAPPSGSQAALPPEGKASEQRISWRVVSTVPETLRPWVQQASHHAGVSTRPTEDGQQWVLIALGQRQTGGYGVEVVNVVERGERIRVTYREHKPAPGALTTQVITYPYTLIEVASSLPVEAVALPAR